MNTRTESLHHFEVGQAERELWVMDVDMLFGQWRGFPGFEHGVVAPAVVVQAFEVAVGGSLSHWVFVPSASR